MIIGISSIERDRHRTLRARQHLQAIRRRVVGLGIRTCFVGLAEVLSLTSQDAAIALSGYV